MMLSLAIIEMLRRVTMAASNSTQIRTPYIFSEWQPWYQGVDRAVGTADLAFDCAPPSFSTPVIRKQNVNALRIDLKNPAVSFLTTPSAPPGSPCQTIGATITGFMAAEPTVMAAVNANFSWYDTDTVGGNFSLMGLAVSQGQVVCDPMEPAPQPGTTPTDPDVPDRTYAGAMAMMITQANEVTFQLVTKADPVDLPGCYTAVAGSPQPVPTGGWPPQLTVAGPLLLVSDGSNQGKPQQVPAEEVAGRTAVGLSADGQYLYLVTLDGCEKAGYQNGEGSYQYGGGYYDIAQWLIIAGAYAGLNLDGGGSTAMACRDGNGDPVLMNVPYGGEQYPCVQRAVGNYFGVVTQPLLPS
jgi:hypothetical protein